MKGYMESLGEFRRRIESGEPPARETTYRGINFRSRLEVRFASHLDRMGEHWRYEPRTYGPRGRGYLPDFEILGSKRRIFIEVKPTIEEIEAAQTKAAVIWETHPDALLIIAAEEGCTFSSCLQGEDWFRWTERWAA